MNGPDEETPLVWNGGPAANIKQEERDMFYPPGMTPAHWKRIDGEQHYHGCPMHEDFEFSDYDAQRIDPYEVKRLVKAADDLGYPYVLTELRKALHPFYWMIDCCCVEITHALKEDAELGR